MRFLLKFRKHAILLWLIGGLSFSTVSFTLPAFADIDPVDAVEDAQFTEVQTNLAAKEFVFKQEQILKEALELAVALEEKKVQIRADLGKERIALIKEAEALPDENLIQRRIRLQKLDELRVEKFADLDLSSSEVIEEVGARVYEEYAMRGGEFALKLGIVIPGLGKAKPTNIDGLVFPRVVHEKTGIAFLFLPEAINLESKHLKMYSARIANNSNKGQGRPYVYAHYDFSKIESDANSIRYQFFKKPNTLKEKFNSKMRANFLWPDAGAVMLTAISVLFQCSTSAGLSYVNYSLGNTSAFDLSSTAVSAAYGTVFGLFASFYNNATRANDVASESSREASRIKRMLITSTTFAYTVFLLKNNGDLSMLSLATWGGWLNQIGLWSNIYMSSKVGDLTTRAYLEMREDMGLSRGTVKIAGVKVKKTQLDDVIASTPARAVRMIGLLDPHMAVGTMMFPFGNFVYFSYALAAQYGVLKYAEKHNFRGTEMLRSKWENFWGPFFRGLKQISIEAVNEGAPGDPLLLVTQTAGRSALYTASMAASLISQDQIVGALQKIRGSVVKVLDHCNSLLSGKGLNKKETEAELPFKPSPEGEWMEFTP